MVEPKGTGAGPCRDEGARRPHLLRARPHRHPVPRAVAGDAPHTVHTPHTLHAHPGAAPHS